MCRTWRWLTGAAMSATVALVDAATAAASGSGGATGLSVKPNSGAPGAAQLGQLVGDTLFYALLACTAGVIVGGAAWALGSHSGNYQATSRGRAGFLTGLGGAVVCGAAVAIVNYGFGLGSKF
jgi:hypothetical protein